MNDPYQNKTFVYSYDLGGNIRQVRTYAYTTGALGTVQETCAYTYGDNNWRDKMTAFGGKAITYDQIGNPTEYDGWSFVWQAGRQLKEMTKDSRYARFSYDHDGMRTRKQTESGRTDYYWSGKRLLELKVGDDLLHMYYDAAGKPAAVSYGNNRYRYVYNLQGDVVALVDAGRAAVVEYRYDAWGKLLATTGSMAATLGKLNPFRYRGYIYDEETGLYWLRSRYYNPEWKRFVNADDTAYLGAGGGLLSYNLFIYCINNPQRFSDHSGYWFGFDDIFTGPIDELLVLGAITLISLFNAESAHQASVSLWQAFQNDAPVASVFQSGIEGRLSDIAGDYGTYKCVEACNSMVQCLQKLKLHGDVVQIRYPARPGYVWSTSQNRRISENGFHCGVEYLGVVFCNVHPFGLPYDAWLNDFSGVGMRTITHIPY